MKILKHVREELYRNSIGLCQYLIHTIFVLVLFLVVIVNIPGIVVLKYTHILYLHFSSQRFYIEFPLLNFVIVVYDLLDSD